MRTKFYLMTVLFLFLVSFPAGARVKLYIQSPPIVSAIPLFWMEEKGCLDEEIDFKVIVSSGHQAGLSLIDREEIQMLVTGVNVGARAYNAGIGINLLNVNVWGIDYLLTYGFKADNWKDLKGKTLCLPLKGGPLDFVVRYLIGKTEIGIEEINLIYKPLPQGAKYFQMGELDAIVLPEPLVTITLENTPQAKLSLDIQKEWAKYHQDDRRIPFVGLFASSTFLEQHPELTEEFRLLYLEGVRWANQNQKEAAELAGKYLKIPPDIFEEAFQRIHFECIASQESRDRVQGYLEEILKIYPELIYGRLPDEEFYQ
jgi:NitT/TauT family transport system substrate-binding protein